jgi:hypothetical protein
MTVLRASIHGRLRNDILPLYPYVQLIWADKESIAIAQAVRLLLRESLARLRAGCLRAFGVRTEKCPVSALRVNDAERAVTEDYLRVVCRDPIVGQSQRMA